MIDKNKIYIGYNKNNKRCLLYELDQNNYKDLEENLNYTIDEIHLFSLVKYSDLVSISNSKCLIAKRFINAYNLEENKEIDLNKIVIGPLYVITGVEYNDINNALCKLQLLKKKELLLCNEDGYTNMFNNQKYNNKFFFEVGDFRVKSSLTKPFVTEIPVSNKTLAKRIVLQLYINKYGL